MLSILVPEAIWRGHAGRTVTAIAKVTRRIWPNEPWRVVVQDDLATEVRALADWLSLEAERRRSR